MKINFTIEAELEFKYDSDKITLECDTMTVSFHNCYKYGMSATERVVLKHTPLIYKFIEWYMANEDAEPSLAQYIEGDVECEVTINNADVVEINGYEIGSEELFIALFDYSLKYWEDVRADSMID